MTTIEMLAYDNGSWITESIEEVYVCTGDPATPTHLECEDCEKTGSRENPVYCWTSAIDMEYCVCKACIEVDEFVRVGLS